jgi:bifunctional non-homologous end joining protein LigD
MIKLNDEYASETDVTVLDRSVVSGQTIEEVAATSRNEWESNRKKKAGSAKNRLPQTADLQLQRGRKTPMPRSVSPMLATLAKEPFNHPDWLFEIKWDGYRAIAILDKKEKAELASRKGISLNKYSSLTDELKRLKINAVLDGEIVVLDDSGHSNFQMLQSWAKDGKGFLCFMVFDLLWYEGYDLTSLALIDRKKILEQVLPASNLVKYCDHVVQNGKDFYNLSVRMGIEGVIAKEIYSAYAPGVRSKSWLKWKNVQMMGAVITGFTEGRNSRKYFGALVLGSYKNGVLEYIGHTGSGMDENTVAAIHKKLQPLVTDKMPFKKKPKTNMPVTWVQPKLVCEVKYQEITADGILRIPIFQGLRADKSVPEIKEETAFVEKIAKKNNSRKKAAPQAQLIPPDQKQAKIILNRKELVFTNLDKLYWPEEGISKRDMLNYYHDVLPYMLPYMRDRPQSLNRHPNGIKGKSFYQKNVKDKVAGWIETYHYTSENDGAEKEYLVCTDEASLMYIANLGCIEMNPWHSRTQSPDQPDWCIIDLDPNGVPFPKVIETAKVVKEILDGAGVTGYCKTSGSTGLHIFIPLGAQYSYEQSKVFAELIAGMVHHELPKITSVERSPSKRKGLIYVDFLQNRSTQTLAAPYSLRPKPGATASAPLHWTEVKKGLSIGKFHIGNMKDRLRAEGDLFGGVLGKGIDMAKALDRLSGMAG